MIKLLYVILLINFILCLEREPYKINFIEIIKDKTDRSWLAMLIISILVCLTFCCCLCVVIPLSSLCCACTVKTLKQNTNMQKSFVKRVKKTKDHLQQNPQQNISMEDVSKILKVASSLA